MLQTIDVDTKICHRLISSNLLSHIDEKSDTVPPRMKRRCILKHGRLIFTKHTTNIKTDKGSARHTAALHYVNF